MGLAFCVGLVFEEVDNFWFGSSMSLGVLGGDGDVVAAEGKGQPEVTPASILGGLEMLGLLPGALGIRSVVDIEGSGVARGLVIGRCGDTERVVVSPDDLAEVIFGRVRWMLAKAVGDCPGEFGSDDVVRIPRQADHGHSPDIPTLKSWLAGIDPIEH